MIWENGDLIHLHHLAYISCPFGLVVLNITNAEIKETYYFTQDGVNAKVFDSHIFNDQINTSNDNFLANKIFVGTDSGLFYANKNDNLLDFQVWKNDCSINLFGLDYDLQGVRGKKVIGYDQGDAGGK